MGEGLASVGPEPVHGVVLVMLADHRWQHTPWAWFQLARGPKALSHVPGLRFAKVMGSGAGGGFGLRPSATHQGLVALFDTAEHADAFMRGPRAQAHRRRSRDWWCGVMTITSARGSWDGCAWVPEPGVPHSEMESQGAPIAAITRASIRSARAVRFWRYAPSAQAALHSAEGCGMAVGLGEAPLLRQCTFSLWRDEASLLAYAKGGAHGEAARAAWQHAFFSESMFVRMRLLSSHGQWPVRELHA